MNAFLRAAEARALAARDELMRETRGAALARPDRDEYGQGVHEQRKREADERKREKAERMERVAELRRQGLDAETIAAKTGLSRSQIYWLEKQQRVAESSRRVVTR